MTNKKSTTQKAFILLFILFTFSFSCNRNNIPKTTGDIKPVNRPAYADWDRFDFDSGYGPGSFIPIKNNRIGAELIKINRERLLKDSENISYLELEENNNIQASSYNAKKEFKNQLNGNGFIKGLRIDLQNEIKNIKDVTAIVQEGRHLKYRDGVVSMLNAIDKMPKNYLENLVILISSYDSVFMVSEVIILDNAYYEIEWESALSADARGQLPGIFSAKNNLTRKADNKFILRFDNGKSVYYKKVFVSEEIKNKIRERISYWNKRDTIIQKFDFEIVAYTNRSPDQGNPYTWIETDKKVILNPFDIKGISPKEDIEKIIRVTDISTSNEVQVSDNVNQYTNNCRSIEADVEATDLVYIKVNSNNRSITSNYRLKFWIKAEVVKTNHND